MDGGYNAKRLAMFRGGAEVSKRADEVEAELARLCDENAALKERVRICCGALTPVSENEKRGMERVLAILDRKLAEGGAVVSSDVAAVERHNAHFRARRSAFSECAMMLRAAMAQTSPTPLAGITR